MYAAKSLSEKKSVYIVCIFYNNEKKVQLTVYPGQEKGIIHI